MASTRLLLMLLICLFAYYLCAQNQANQALIQASEFSRNGQFAESLPYYISCLEENGNNSECLNGKANALYSLGDIPSAKNIYHALERDSSNQPAVFRPLASIYELEENIPKAVRYYSLLSRVDTTNAYYLRKLAQLYDKAGLHEDAFKNYAKAYSLNSIDNFTVQGLVEFFLSNKQAEEADSLLSLALQRDTSNVKFRLLRSRCQYMKKDYSSAAQNLASLSRDIDLPNYFSKMLGYSYMQIDSLEKAIRYLLKSLNNEPAPEYAEYYLAVAHEKLNDPESAAYYYERALKSAISDNTHLYHRQLAYIAMERNEMKPAIEHLESSLRYVPDADVLFKLSRLYDDYYKDKNIAIRSYKKFLNSDSSDRELRKYAEQRWRYLRGQVHMGER